jgi:hypothetical protein
MTYVDLDPVRSGIAPDLPASAPTSIRRRLQKHTDAHGHRALEPVVGPPLANSLILSLDQ